MKYARGGLYRYIRHPRYLGLITLGTGLSLLFRSWIGLILTVLFLGVLLLRIRDEEALLHQAFGTDWDQYCHQSWRLLPFVF